VYRHDIPICNAQLRASASEV